MGVDHVYVCVLFLCGTSLRLELRRSLVHAFDVLAGCGCRYDLTLSYEESPPGTRPSEQSIIGTTMPKAMHVFFKRYDVKVGGRSRRASMPARSEPCL